MTLREIYKLIKKRISEPNKFSDKQVSYWLNRAMDLYNCYCPLPECHHRSKNWVGNKIHMAKKHGWTKKEASKFLKENLL